MSQPITFDADKGRHQILTWPLRYDRNGSRARDIWQQRNFFASIKLEA
jgi:hypothetical protein